MRDFWKIRDSLGGAQIVIPTAIHRQILSRLHDSRGEIEATNCRPQSNGHAEAYAKQVKHLIMKTTKGGNLDDKDFDRGLLEVRNTPRPDGRSPAQIPLGRSLRTAMPAHWLHQRPWPPLPVSLPRGPLVRACRVSSRTSSPCRISWPQEDHIAKTKKGLCVASRDSGGSPREVKGEVTEVGLESGRSSRERTFQSEDGGHLAARTRSAATPLNSDSNTAADLHRRVPKATVSHTRHPETHRGVTEVTNIHRRVPQAKDSHTRLPKATDANRRAHPGETDTRDGRLPNFHPGGRKFRLLRRLQRQDSTESRLSSVSEESFSSGSAGSRRAASSAGIGSTGSRVTSHLPRRSSRSPPLSPAAGHRLYSDSPKRKESLTLRNLSTYLLHRPPPPPPSAGSGPRAPRGLSHRP
ncbi:uncharacterized protein LOC121874423 [Homarus americanus]|uniref:uncharacterized protein LOC121874423 n=1 Tax=Homarus americanus TaxID=6706 RepID=UPI001C495E40|nr:uncharacterized protein LOC121874423 [Homarus americanus]